MVKALGPHMEAQGSTTHKPRDRERAPYGQLRGLQLHWGFLVSAVYLDSPSSSMCLQCTEFWELIWV